MNNINKKPLDAMCDSKTCASLPLPLRHAI